LLEQARKLSKERKQRKGNEVKLIDISTGEETIFHSLSKASKKTWERKFVFKIQQRKNLA